MYDLGSCCSSTDTYMATPVLDGDANPLDAEARKRRRTGCVLPHGTRMLAASPRPSISKQGRDEALR